MVIILVALIVLGPEQLPKAMRTFGNVMAEIRKVSGGFQAEMKSAMDSFTAEVDNAAEKPQSAKMAEATPATPADSDVTEVVARNELSEHANERLPGPSANPAHADAVLAAPATEPAADRPAISAADRASG